MVCHLKFRFMFVFMPWNRYTVNFSMTDAKTTENCANSNALFPQSDSVGDVAKKLLLLFSVILFPQNKCDSDVAVAKF